MTGLLFPGRAFDAVLFDMDGTILSSIAAAERVWTEWGRRHGVDAGKLLRNIHGVRAEETVRRFAPPGSDFAAEVDAITRAEIEDVDGIEPIPGASAFLAALPAGRWAVVTSAPRALAERRLDAGGLPRPPLMITAEDVTRGKPEPDGFLLAAKRLGVSAKNCLVFEDAPAGIAAAEAAGAAVVVVTATHTHPLETRHPSVPGFEGLIVQTNRAGMLDIRTRA